MTTVGGPDRRGGGRWGTGPGLACADVPAGTEALDAEGLPTFTLLGMVGLLDPPREEAIAAVAQCQSAGIRVEDDHR